MTSPRMHYVILLIILGVLGGILYATNYTPQDIWNLCFDADESGIQVTNVLSRALTAQDGTLTTQDILNQAYDADQGALQVILGGVELRAYTADPCSGLNEGAIFYNTTTNVPCFCDGTNDLKISDGSACF